MGTRPSKSLGTDKQWEYAEEQLKRILEKSGSNYFVEEGDGAFYGPKIDVIVKDSLGRDV